MTDPEPIFLLANQHAAAPFDKLRARIIRTADQARAALSNYNRQHARWIAPTAAPLRHLSAASGTYGTSNSLLVLEGMTIARRELLDAVFKVVIAPGDGVTLVPKEVLVEVLPGPNAHDLFIGGA